MEKPTTLKQQLQAEIQIRKIEDKYVESLGRAYCTAAFAGDIKTMRELAVQLEDDYWTPFVFQEGLRRAASNNQGKALLEVIAEVQLRKLVLKPTSDIYLSPARYGHLDILLQLSTVSNDSYKPPVPNYDDILCSASEGSHIDVMDWAVKNGARNLDVALISAAENGELRAMEWIYSHGGRNIKPALSVAFRTKQCQVTEWCRSKWKEQEPTKEEKKYSKIIEQVQAQLLLLGEAWITRYGNKIVFSSRCFECGTAISRVPWEELHHKTVVGITLNGLGQFYSSACIGCGGEKSIHATRYCFKCEEMDFARAVKSYTSHLPLLHEFVATLQEEKKEILEIAIACYCCSACEKARKQRDRQQAHYWIEGKREMTHNHLLSLPQGGREQYVKALETDPVIQMLADMKRFWQL